MEEDLVTSLTRQVKEEVIENYIRERRLVELQIEHLGSQADETRKLARRAGKRLTRLSRLMLRPDMRERMGRIIGIKNGCFWSACFDEKMSNKIPLVRVRALTGYGRFRKLVLESYSRFFNWMKKYRAQYQDLAEECAAVNRNVNSFQRNFDLLALLNFLRNLDMQGIEKKNILGDNFTAKEMSELDKNLFIRPIALEKLGAPVPIELPGPDAAKSSLSDLADEIYRRHSEQVKEMLEQ